LNHWSGICTQTAARKATRGESVHSTSTSETQLARVLQSKLPPLRCVGEDWLVYREGVWGKTRKDEFKPLALSIQHETARKARNAIEILKHADSYSVTPIWVFIDKDEEPRIVGEMDRDVYVKDWDDLSDLGRIAGW
jgi:hypothetical protein